MWQDGQPVLLESDELTIPHPRAAERSFVTVPWNDIELPDQFRDLVGHGAITSLESTRDQLEQLPERLDT